MEFLKIRDFLCVSITATKWGSLEGFPNETIRLRRTLPSGFWGSVWTPDNCVLARNLRF